MAEVKTALISVYAKEGIDVFAKKLVDRGWQILASGGTAKFLESAGIPVKDVADLIGGAAILGHRVVTLSREVHAGLLSRNIPEDIAEMERLGLTRIDLVCCDFYPLVEEIAKPGATTESVIEKTDVGGPTMVHSGAKGSRIVICDPDDRQMVIDQLEAAGDVDEKTRQHLRAKAEAVVAAYCLDSARFHGAGEFDGFIGRVIFELAYGENRDQSPAYLYSTGTDDPLAWDKFEVVSGLPGFINMADGDRTLQILCLMAEAYRRNFEGKVPFIAIACKHGNPCGAAVDWNDPKTALTKALLGDHIAVMGAEVMTNFVITDELAQNLFGVPSYLFTDELAQNLFGASSYLSVRVNRELWGVDVVFAPGFSEEAIKLLGKKERRRLLANLALANPVMSGDEWVIRPVRGGFLRQKASRFVFESAAVEEWTGQQGLGPDDYSSLIIAWAVTWRASSNTVALAKRHMLIGLGCGQQDRIACVKLCLDRAERAGHNPTGSLFASDAFFPYARRKKEEDPLEGPELLNQAGCIGGVVPADGKNLAEVKEFFASTGMAVAFLLKEHRGFSGH